jgi:hypothetical protein
MGVVKTTNSVDLVCYIILNCSNGIFNLHHSHPPALLLGVLRPVASCMTLGEGAEGYEA